MIHVINYDFVQSVVSREDDPMLNPGLNVKLPPKKTESEKLNLLQGAAAEAQLIDWPTIGTAASQTATVIVLMVVSSVTLLAVNALLGKIAEEVF